MKSLFSIIVFLIATPAFTQPLTYVSEKIGRIERFISKSDTIILTDYSKLLDASERWISIKGIKYKILIHESKEGK